MYQCPNCKEEKFIVTVLGFEKELEKNIDRVGVRKRKIYETQNVDGDGKIYQHRCLCCGHISLFDKDKTKKEVVELPKWEQSGNDKYKLDIDTKEIHGEITEFIDERSEFLAKVSFIDNNPVFVEKEFDNLYQAKQWVEKWFKNRLSL